MPKSLFRRCFSAFYIIFFLLSILILPASAEDGRVIRTFAYASGGYGGDEEVFSPRGSDYRSFGMNSGVWKLNGGYVPQSKKFYGRRTVLETSLDSGTLDGVVTYSQSITSKTANAGDYSAFRFGLRVDGEDTEYRISVSLKTDEGSIEGDFFIRSNTWNHVYVDLSGTDGWISEICIEADFSDGREVTKISMSSAFLAENTSPYFEIARKFSTTRLAASAGYINLNTGRVRADEFGRVFVSGTLVTDEVLRLGADAFFEVKLDGVDSGNMTLGVMYAGGSDEQRIYSKKISLSPTDETYTVPVEVYGDICEFSLQFDNIVAEGDFFNLLGVEVYSGEGIRVEADTSIGSVHSVTLSNGGICFDGVMDREAASRFADEKLLFCATPSWTPFRQDGVTVIGETKVSTKFTYTAQTASLPYSPDLYMYFVAVRRDGEYVPISSPAFPQSGTVGESELSTVGLHGASTVGAFESNSSHVIVDIPLTQLIVENSSVTDEFIYRSESQPDENGATSPVTVRVGLDKQLLAELTREIDFYTSTGTEVYLRLIANGEIKGLTYSSLWFSKSCSVNASDANSLRMYEGLVSALSERFPSVGGFVLGEGVNYAQYVGNADIKQTAKYAEELARLCRITYNASSKYISDVLVIVPFVENQFEGNSNNIWLSDRTLSVMLSKHLDEIGRVPWAFMYSVDSFEDRVSSPTALLKLLSDLQIKPPEAVMILCTPSEELLFADYRENGDKNENYPEYAARKFTDFRLECERGRVRAVIMSLSDTTLANEKDFYSTIKLTSDSADAVFELPISTNPSVGMKGSYALWDFSDKHYPLGWIPGGNYTCITDYSELFTDEGGKSSRVLRLSLSEDERASEHGVSGMVLRNFPRTINMKDITSVDFTFSVDAEYKGADVDGVRLAFVIGTDEKRAEFYADLIESGTAYTVSCDLSDYPYRGVTDYIGVIVYSSGDAVLDISKITVNSNTLDSTELKELFLPSDSPEKNRDGLYIWIVAAFGVLLLSLIVFILLQRHERDEREGGKIPEKESLEDIRERRKIL